MVDIGQQVEEPLTLEELKERCRDKIARMFAEKLPEVAQGMIDLALTSEIDSVRFRAQSRIMEEFSQSQGKPMVQGGTNVQIINAIPFERAAYEKGKELEQVDVGALRVATPSYKKVLPTGDEKAPTSRETFSGGTRITKDQIDARKMANLGNQTYAPLPPDLVVPAK